MTGGRDMVTLRQLVGGVVEGLVEEHTHDALGDACMRLGLPQPAAGGTKRERVRESFAAVVDDELPAVAERVLLALRPDPATRNVIQDLLWAGGSREIPKRTRREIARSLGLQDLVHGADRFRALLDRLWVLDNDPFASVLTGRPAGLGARIDQHVFRNPGDWETEYLFEQLGAIEAGDARFIRFLEGLVSPEVMPDEPAQRRIVETINECLRVVAAELRETGTEDGYPVFRVVASGLAHARRPKNLIFASLAKPDLRFRSAVDNDVEIVGNADKVLVYDRPISADGIRWRDLQAWWRETHQLPSDVEAKATLYNRLGECLPRSSPPQRNLWELYHAIHGPAVPDLPALLPEVWLHWDPKTVRSRGRDALFNQRMDFLLLLPHGQRIVLEVDGAQHYSTPDGRANTAEYAATVRADRDLKLSGYEVFRFGATELIGRDDARSLLQQFFTELFRRFDVSPRTD
ncbi:hypothetical protein RM780_10035 [Streptomyces sp. DSM 44917]|uniref:AbiJ-NTD3 domain-containing protein n=1 Tax=Streptomyces boetiae TaxID=3075541 RepID=A0ABU2L770_9ACTN|nr:hypothetical protein [Streptomyces sp. DSM 44917]MDT0307301.1 hypothetical protein [Streptomyces sp. DSM 44917]